VKKEVIKPLVGGIAIGAIALLIIVFWTGWVVKSSSAELQGKDMAKAAVIEALTPICVEQYLQDPNKVERLEELKTKRSYLRGDYVEEIGWATMPGAESHVRGVADACAIQIIGPPE